VVEPQHDDFLFVIVELDSTISAAASPLDAAVKPQHDDFLFVIVGRDPTISS